MKILIIRLSSLGDVILAQPVVSALRNRFPGAEITFCAKPAYAGLVRMMGQGIEVLEYEKNLFWHLALRKRRFDLVLDLHGKLASWLIRVLAPAPRKAVYGKQRRLRRMIVAGKSNKSIASTTGLYFSALDKLGLGGDKIATPVLTPPAHMKVEGLPEGPAPLIANFPGAAHATKAWPTNQYREFLDLCGGSRRIILLGSAADSQMAEHIAQGHPEAANLCGKFDFERLAGVLAQCDLVISGDSGPMHLAAALNRPQIAIFGGTHPSLGFAPQNDRAVVLCADLDCQPCSLHGLERCPQGHFNCMKLVTPQLVCETAAKLLR